MNHDSSWGTTYTNMCDGSNSSSDSTVNESNNNVLVKKECYKLAVGYAVKIQVVFS
jgi:hypothetical protein